MISDSIINITKNLFHFIFILYLLAKINNENNLRTNHSSLSMKLLFFKLCLIKSKLKKFANCFEYYYSNTFKKKVL